MKNRKRIVNGIPLTTVSEEIYSANILEVECGTTGRMGGDTGHGGRTLVRFADLGGTDMTAKVKEDKYGNPEVTIMLGGDCELYTFRQAIRFIDKELTKAIGDEDDEPEGTQERIADALERIASSLQSNMTSPSLATSLDEIAVCIHEGRCATDVESIADSLYEIVDNM